MTEPKNIEPDLPEEETPAYDEPPAPAEDPPYEDDDAPATPDEPQDEPLFETEDSAEPEPAPEPLFEPEEAPRAEASAPEPEPELEPEAEYEPEPEPEPELYEPELFEAEAVEAAPEVVAPVEIEAAPAEPPPPPPPPPRRAPPVEAVEDLHGPEPWDHAPATSLAPSLGAALARPEPLARPAVVPDVGPESPAAAPVGETPYEIKRAAYAIYLVYLTALMVVSLPLMPFACWLAYQRRVEAPQWLRSHYTYQVRTFWITVGGLALAGVFVFAPFGLAPLTVMLTAVWLVMRCFVGMVRLHRGEPIFNPQTWMV